MYVVAKIYNSMHIKNRMLTVFRKIKKKKDYTM